MQNERVGLCFHNLVLIMVVKAPGDSEKEELPLAGLCSRVVQKFCFSFLIASVDGYLDHVLLV